MQSHTKFTNLFIFICLISLTSLGSGQELSAEPMEVAEAGETELPFPYIAEITDDNVNIRSGPGTNYYHCGKLNTGQRIKVVARKYGWSHIVPPSGSFSWISKQYVSVDQDTPNMGTVTGDAVRVYAGSDMLKPIHSTTVQLHLNKNDKVMLMGEEIDDYYKIAPPTGAYLWVLTKYATPLGSVGEVPPIAEVPPTTEPKVVIPPAEETPPVVIVSSADESAELKEYYALTKQIEAEQVKPIAKQDYEKIKKKLAEIADNKKSGKAARYAEYAIKQIGRYELALAVDNEVKLQETELHNTFEQIEKTRDAGLTQVPELGGFTAIGRLQASTIFGAERELKHYFITNNTGQMICYALPEGPASEVDLSNFLGKTVGLVGRVEPYPETQSALVRFTKITKLD